MSKEQTILTLKEAAGRQKVCCKTLRRDIDIGKLRAFRIGRQLRIRESALEEYQKRLEDDFVSGGLIK